MYRNMITLVRGVQRVGTVFKHSSNIIRISSFNKISTASKAQIIDGNNGERIYTSPYGDIDLPSLTVQDYVWKNMNKWPERIAVECGITGRKYTYAQARDKANCIAKSLKNMGLQDGDVVAIILPNLPESPISFLGILEAGLVVTTVNPMYTIDEISRQLKFSKAKALITCGTIAPNAVAAGRAVLPSNAPIIVVQDTKNSSVPDGTISFKDLIEKGSSLPPIKEVFRSPDELAILPFSSGTTGMPKGVQLTHRNLVSTIVMTDNSSTLMNTGYQDIIIASIGFFHIYGAVGLMLPRLSDGAKLVTLPFFTPDSFVNALANNECTLMYCVPSMILFFGASPLVKAEYFKSVRSVFSGAAPLAETDVLRMYEKFGITSKDLQIAQGYGLTECSCVAFLELSNRKFSSIGRPIIKCEVRLVDPKSGNDIANTGETGEIWLRGPNIMKGYLDNEEETKKTLQNGWLKTGDIAYFDDDLDFYITDRLKELIKVKGFQVPPAELEAVLRTHPDIADAAVIGVPDARCGEVPRAFVVLKDKHSATEENIQNYMKGKVSEFKELKGGVRFINQIPRNATGKILRISLKDHN